MGGASDLTPHDPAGGLDAAVASLWIRYAASTEERLATLEDAVSALGRGRLDAGLCAAAEGEAHKLAGSLGSFGLADGSRLAFALEGALARSGGLASADAPRLATLVRELRIIVRRGPSTGGGDGA